MAESDAVPAISIVVPIYNAEAYLAQTLAGIQAQTRQDWELIAVDDGSIDGSAAIVQRFAQTEARIRLIQQANAGVAAARNRGYAETCPHSEYVILLDHDDVWEPDLLARLADCLKSRPDACAAYGSMRAIDETGQAIPEEIIQEKYARFVDVIRNPLTVNAEYEIVPADKTHTTFATMAVQNCLISPGLLLLRRASLPIGNLFDPDTAPCDDWDLYLRLTRRAPFVHVPDATLNYRLHHSNASWNGGRMSIAWQTMARKASVSPDNTPEQRRILRAGFDYAERMEVKRRLGWARGCLRNRQPIHAAKQVYQMSKILVRLRLGLR